MVSTTVAPFRDPENPPEIVINMKKNALWAVCLFSTSVDSFTPRRITTIWSHQRGEMQTARQPTLIYGTSWEELAKEWAAVNRGEQVPAPTVPPPSTSAEEKAMPAVNVAPATATTMTIPSEAPAVPKPVAAPQAFQDIVPTPKAVRPPPPPSLYEPPPAPPKPKPKPAKRAAKKAEGPTTARPENTATNVSVTRERRTLASQAEKRRISAKKGLLGVMASALFTLLLVTAGPPLQQQLNEQGSYLNRKVSKVMSTNTSPALKTLDAKKSSNTLKSFQSIVHPEPKQLGQEKAQSTPPLPMDLKKETTPATPTTNIPEIVKREPTPKAPTAETKTEPVASVMPQPVAKDTHSVPKPDTKPETSPKSDMATVSAPPVEAKKEAPAVTPTIPPAPVEAPKPAEAVSQPVAEPQVEPPSPKVTLEPLPQANAAVAAAEKYVLQPRPEIVDTEMTFEDIMKQR